MTKKTNRKRIALAALAACLLGGCSVAQPAREPASAPEPIPGIALRECTAGTDDGYYTLDVIFDGWANLTYIDCAAHRQVFLCEQPGCMHQTDACRSCLPLGDELAIPALFAVGDHLILEQTAATQSTPPNIAIADLDGGNRRPLAQFPGNYTLSTSVYTDESALYLAADANEPETAQATRKILRVSLADGAVSELYSYPKNELTPYIAGSFGGKLVMASILTKPGGTTLLEYRLFDVETIEMDVQELALCDIGQTGSFVDGEALYEISYADSRITATSLRTGEKTSVDYSAALEAAGGTGRAAVFPVGENLLRLEIPAQDVFHEFLLDVQSGEWRPFTLLKEYNRDAVTLLGRYGDCYLVCKDWIMSDAVDSQGAPRMEFAPQYALIRTEDLRNSSARYVPVASDVYPSAWGG